jgi:SAM-dependent methyltransferase
MFPNLYDTHHRLHNEDLPFWSELAQQYPGPILEEGCGTGRILFELAKSGKDVVGIDLDHEMLAFLYKKSAASIPSNIFVLQANFTAFHLAARFGLIILACNTYSTQTASQRKKLLECARWHMQPGGAFAISIPNPPLLKQLPRFAAPELEEVFTHPLDGEPVQVVSEWKRERQLLLIDWHYDHLLPDGNIERLTIHVNQHLFPYDQILAEFRLAGFHHFLTYGDYDETEYTPYSQLLILIASE